MHDDDVADEVSALRRMPFVLGAAVGALAVSADIVIPSTTLSTVEAVLRLAISLSIAAAAVGVATRRLSQVTGERMVWPGTVVFCLLELSPMITSPTTDGAAAGQNILLVHVLLVLATYLVWPPAPARWLVGALTMLAYVGLAQTVLGRVTPGETLRFLVVPLVLVSLSASFPARARVLAGVAERASAEARIGRTDQLTGLPNRRSLLPRLESLRPGEAVLLVDVDHFKTVNDEHGHEIGDAVLRRIAGLLSGAVRDGDVIGRWGGEEFVVIAGPTRSGEGIDPEQLAGLAERLCAAVRSDSSPPPVTVSIGVARCLPDDVDWQDSLRRADACLYAAKEAGRDRVAHDPTPPTDRATV